MNRSIINNYFLHLLLSMFLEKLLFNQRAHSMKSHTLHTIMLTLGPLLCDEKIKNLCFHGSPKGRCKKKRIYLRLCPKLWVSGSKGGSKVPNFLVKITIQLFLLQTSRNVLKHILHKWGGHIWPFHDDLRPQQISTLTH